MDKNVDKALAAVVVTAIVVNTALGLTNLAVEKSNEQQKTEQRSK
jgi:multisubunit Na+/H+ antiporter MnhC subunit